MKLLTMEQDIQSYIRIPDHFLVGIEIKKSLSLHQ